MSWGERWRKEFLPFFSASAPDRRKKKITPCRMDEKIKKLHSPNPAAGRAVRNCSGKREEGREGISASSALLRPRGKKVHFPARRREKSFHLKKGRGISGRGGEEKERKRGKSISSLSLLPLLSILSPFFPHFIAYRGR